MQEEYWINNGYCAAHGGYWFLCKGAGCIKHFHECMRCGLLFGCLYEGECQAGFRTLPTRVIGGSHCPAAASWDWIRAHSFRFARQYEARQGFPTDHPARCHLREGSDWRCHKEAAHEGPCSARNDCGEEGPEHSTCGLPRRHAGRHGWELVTNYTRCRAHNQEAVPLERERTCHSGNTGINL